MPRVSVTEVAHRAAVLGTPYQPEDRGYMALARAIWALLGEYDHFYGVEHPLGIALREIERELS